MPDRLSSMGAELADARDAAHVARSAWQVLGRSGVLRELAGDDPAEATTDHLARLVAELDAALPLGVVLSACVQLGGVVPLLRTIGRTSPLATDVLDQLLAGEAMVALAITDAGAAGSAVVEMHTTVTDDGEGLILHGSKEWITNALHCDHALVLAHTGGSRSFTNFGWVLVPMRQSGCARRAATTLFEGAGVGHLDFDGVALGRDHLVGRRSRALAEFAQHVSQERLIGAIWGRSLCRRVLLETLEHLRHRSTGSATLWDNAAIRERFAEGLVEWHRLDALCAAHAGRPTPVDGMLLKVAYSDSVTSILDTCVRLRGADAFRRGGLAELRAEAAMFSVAGGATGAMLAGIADHADEVLGAP